MTAKKKAKKKATPKVKRPPKPGSPIHEGLMVLRCGAHEKVLAKVEVDLSLWDPPYSKKTHDGHNAATSNDGSERALIDYAHLTPRDVKRLVKSWHPRTRGWFVVFTDHVLMPAWEDAMADAGRYVFAGMPVIIPGMTVRKQGDGPSREAVYLVAGRWRTAEAMRWRTLPGWYKATRDRWSEVTGGKPLNLMEQLVRHYSNPGDVVCDAFAGHGTTLYAAAKNGRRGLGCEVDPKRWLEADARLRQAHTPDLVALYERHATPILSEEHTPGVLPFALEPSSSTPAEVSP